jgi:bacterioferritin
MKGDPRVIDALNKALTIELTAVNQYFLQAKMCVHWGYGKIGKRFRDESIEEMRHADRLIERILYLEGSPNVTRYGEVRIGTTVKEQLENSLKLERSAVKAYNEAIALAAEAKDAGSREVMDGILVESEEDAEWLEAHLHVIEEIGLANYLAQQTGGEG